MKMLKKCVKWYFNALANAYKGENYRYYRGY